MITKRSQLLQMRRHGSDSWEWVFCNNRSTGGVTTTPNFKQALWATGNIEFFEHKFSGAGSFRSISQAQFLKEQEDYKPSIAAPAKPVLDALRAIPCDDGCGRDNAGIAVRGGSVYRDLLDPNKSGFSREELKAARDLLRGTAYYVLTEELECAHRLALPLEVPIEEPVTTEEPASFKLSA